MPCACTLAHPYVPDQNVPWATVDLDAYDTSCKGDFEHKKLNTELRRFAFRDAGSLFVGCGYVVITVARVLATDPNIVHAVLLAVLYVVLVAVVFAFLVDLYAHFLASQLKYTTSAIRVFCMITLSLTSAISPIAFVTEDIVQCGDRDAMFSSNNTNVSLPALADRQQYCINVIEPYTAGTYVTMVFIFHLYPQHGIPLIALTLLTQLVGYAFAPDQSEEMYGLSTGTVAVSVIMHFLFAIGAMVIIRHVHAAMRSRFVAAAKAERARQLATRELDGIDTLLKATLPQAVLDRVAGSGDVHDASDNVTVVYGSLVGFSAWAPTKLAPDNAATL
eukprot:CAMPEP_0174838644 /NCGR_PEP_ID=MMETSP1114-20130205/7525_1 /TAXON_ID=312471 /ORGANISM="Neobodo designis, Strain CCAP 1951/1" /LENGTH=332 /DNA_ID=CAMNT_0016072747 /DNA_START=8 /DNA_END=1003 /DNA_ORIENTATION=-